MDHLLLVSPFISCGLEFTPPLSIQAAWGKGKQWPSGQAAERGTAAAGRGAGPPSCSRKAARGGAAALGAELRA